MELLGEGGEKGRQGQNQSSQDSCQPSRLASAQGHHQRSPQPAPAQLNHSNPHCPILNIHIVECCCCFYFILHTKFHINVSKSLSMRSCCCVRRRRSSLSSGGWAMSSSMAFVRVHNTFACRSSRLGSQQKENKWKEFLFKQSYLAFNCVALWRRSSLTHRGKVRCVWVLTSLRGLLLHHIYTEFKRVSSVRPPRSNQRKCVQLCGSMTTIGDGGDEEEEEEELFYYTHCKLGEIDRGPIRVFLLRKKKRRVEDAASFIFIVGRKE